MILEESTIGGLALGLFSRNRLSDQLLKNHEKKLLVAEVFGDQKLWGRFGIPLGLR